MTNHATKLSVCAFGCAWGLIWALGTLLTAWLGWWFHWALPWIQVLGSAYIGYAPTFWGGVIGAVWGFVDFFIFGALVAWVYNACSCCKHCQKESA